MEFIDLYCERTQLGFWNEPLNILSNLAFFIASLSLFYRIRTFQKVSKFYLFFSALIAVIGFGSIMFHAHPVPLTLWADVLPIFSFILFYLTKGEYILECIIPLCCFYNYSNVIEFTLKYKYFF